MAIVGWPDDVPIGEAVQCGICGREIPLTAATVGPPDGLGRLSFACNAHYHDYADRLYEWALFGQGKPTLASQPPGGPPTPVHGTYGMGRLYIEHREVRSGTLVPWDLARHLYTRQTVGTAVVVTDAPDALLPPLRKQWLKLARCLQQERARTTEAKLILALTNTIITMQQRRFTVKPHFEAPDADVYLIRPDWLDQVPRSCRTLYALCPAQDAALTGTASYLSNHSLAVIYTETKRMGED